MGHFTIYRDNYVDSTVVSNRFIDEYMKDANDAQLKIYLYLIRMMSANLSTSVSEIADKFNHTEKDVFRALKYWEKQHLLALDYDETKTLIGIHLQDPAESPSVPVAAATSAAPVLSIVPRISGSAPTVPEEPVEDPFAKPAYTSAQLLAFRERQETEELFFIAESYLGRPLTPSDMRTILYFSDCLHFSNDLIDYLIQYCVERGKKSFKYIEAVAISWAREGITTPKQAERYSAKYDKSVYTVMKALGRDGAPTAKEADFITRWVKEYGFTADIIQEACDRTVLATDKHRFEYADGILRSWKEDNVRRKSDIQKIDEVYQKRRSAKAASQPANKFNQFAQHDYDFAALEREILSN